MNKSASERSQELLSTVDIILIEMNNEQDKEKKKEILKRLIECFKEYKSLNP
jgi:hypothetical protein